MGNNFFKEIEVLVLRKHQKSPKLHTWRRTLFFDHAHFYSQSKAQNLKEAFLRPIVSGVGYQNLNRVFLARSAIKVCVFEIFRLKIWI